MITIDPHDRIDLTGPWAGFGFQGGHMFTPEGHQLEPGDMAWWSLICNIAREWRLMMAEARAEVAFPPTGQILQIAGRAVHVHQEGQGPDLVLIHGASGNTREFTMGLVARLAPQRPPAASRRSD